MLELRLLGNFNLVYQAQVVETFHDSPRLQTLLAYLVLHCDAPQPRQHIAFLFWPDSTEKQARTNLRKLLLQLRRALPDAEQYLADTHQTIQWIADSPYWFDVAEVRRLLTHIDEANTDRAMLIQLSHLYTGELLPNCYDDWLIPLRQELHDAITQALTQLVHQLEAATAYHEGIRYAQRLLHLDPLEETGYLQLMRLRALSGDRTGALQTYQECVTILRRELDVEPAAAIQTLAKQLQAGILPTSNITPFPGHPREPAATSQPIVRGLQAATTPCFGRAAEVQQLTELLTTPHCRLLTLYGPGGMGKTRLAIALVETLLTRFAQGIAFVPLAPLRTTETVAPAIAKVLDLHLVEGRRPEIQLLAHLQNRQLLLVLDNAEHLLTDDDVHADYHDNMSATERGATEMTPLFHELVEQLLATAPELKILITSREPLSLYEEYTFALQGLSFHPPHESQELATTHVNGPTTDSSSPTTDIGFSAAEELFYHQLMRVRPELTVAALSPADRTAIRQICQLVEGMPLALELAATQLRAVTPTTLITAVQKDLDTLEVRWRGSHQRHQSLRAVIDRSVSTLDARERLIFLRLAIFQGGFTTPSAQAVAATLADTLERLVQKSLLRHAVDSQRFDMHSLIRQYAFEHLRQLPAEMDQTARRYHQYYATFLSDGMAVWRQGDHDLQQIAPLNAELSNLNAVAQWLLAAGTIGERQPFLLDLWELYRLERRLPEIISLLNEAIATTQRVSAAGVKPVLAQWHRMLGEAYHILGEFGASKDHFEETLRVLDFPLTGSGIGLVKTLQRQGLQQVLNRLHRRNLFRTSNLATAAEAGLMEAIEAYRQLVDISLFSGDLMRLVNSALYALNLAERTADPAALGLTYGLMCLMMGAVPGVKLGEMYEALTIQQLPNVQAPFRRLDIAIYLSAYYAGQGEWTKLDALMQSAIAESQALFAYRRWGYCQAIWASTFIYRGQFTQGLQAWRTLYEQSLASDSFLFILPAWAAGGMALCNARLGALQQAIHRAEQSLAHLQGKDDVVGRARCHAAIALAALRMPDQQMAFEAAERASAQISTIRPTNYAALECYAWVAEVYTTLWRERLSSRSQPRQHIVAAVSDDTNQSVTAAMLAKKSQRALQALQRYAQVFPIGRAAAARIAGDIAWIEGRRDKAYESWQQCLNLASALEMRYEVGCAHHRLATYLPVDHIAREQHRQQAATIFADLHTSQALTPTRR